MNLPSKLVIGLAAIAAIVGGCGSAVQFERALGSGRYPAMPGNAAIAMASDVASLPQPAVVLGELRLPATKGATPQGRAEELLLDTAGRYGCDAIAEVREERVDAFGKKTGNADIDLEHQWVAKCVRTAKAEAVALAVSPRPKAAAPHRPVVNAAEIEQKKLSAEAEKARKDAERLAAVAAEKEKQAKLAAEAAEKERVRIEKAEKARLEGERKRREAEEEQRRREAEQAERERKRKEAEAEERAKKETEERARKEAEAAEKELRRKEAEIDKARKDAEEKARRYAELTDGGRKRKEAAAEKARKEAEDKARKDAEAAAEKERKKNEAEAQKQAKVDAKKATDQAKKDEQAKKEADARAKQQADERARKEAEDKARKEAEDKARKEAEEKARKDYEERAKKEAEDKARKEAEEKARKDSEEKARKEADEKAKQLAEEKARKEAEDKARQQAEAAARKPTKPGKEGKQVDWKARFESAQSEDTESAWLDLLGGMPDGEDNDRAYERLQRAFRGRAGTWLSLDAAKVAADEVETAAVGDPAQLKRELSEAGATTARFLVPREYTQVWTLRNPTKHPVVVDLRSTAGRIVRQLDAGATASGTLKAACPPLGPPLRSKVGLVLEYRFGCDVAKAAPKLGAVRPLRRDLAIDRKAGDPDPSLEAIAKLWSSNPGTRLADVHLWAIDEAMRKRGDEVGQVSGKVHAGERTASGGQAVKVELRNSSARDLTVVFEVGTGRDERLTVPHRGSESIRLELPAGKAPELHIKAAVPKLRSLDWLVGLWSFQGVSLVILPGPGGLQAWAVEPAAGDDASPKLHAFAVRQVGAEVVLEAEPPGLVALALFADKTPAACDKRCAIAVKIKLTDQDRFIAGAGRVLLAVVEIPGKTGTFEFNADN